MKQTKNCRGQTFAWKNELSLSLPVANESMRLRGPPYNKYLIK